MNTQKFEINGHTVAATFDVQDLRTEESFSRGDENAFGEVQVSVDLVIDGNSGYSLLLQNDGGGDLCVGHVAELSCEAEYKRILAAISWPVKDEEADDYGVEDRVDYVLDESLKEVIAAAQIVFDEDVK